MWNLLLSLMLVFFTTSEHPLMMAFILMVLSAMYSLILTMSTMTSWLSYMLFMIFITGLMIMIIYMTSLSSNEPLELKSKNIPIYLLTTLLLMLTISSNSADKKYFKEFNYMEEPSFFLMHKTYDFCLVDMTIVIVIYLLVTLLVAMKLVLDNKTPMKMYK